MSAVRRDDGANFNVLGLVATTLTAGATTQTITAVATGGILTVARDGVKATLSAGAKNYAQYYGNGKIDSRTHTLTAGQACIIVLGLLNVSGTETLVTVVGDKVDLDEADQLKGPLYFPAIGDLIVPVAYATVKNPTTTSTATFTFGTTNWNATSIATSIKDIAVLPKRPLSTI